MSELDPELVERLQAWLDNRNAEDPPDHTPPWLLAIFRHPCTRARQSKKLAGKGVSTAIDLKERYITMAEIENDPEADTTHAIIFREGSCKKCGQVARSEVGKVVLTAERPPITGRVGRV